MSRRTLAILIAAVLSVVAGTAGAPPAAAHSTTKLTLPAGFPPEGIAIGDRPYAYFGSRSDGDILRVNIVTGERRTISQGPGTPSLGLKLDKQERLFVAGGTGGDARVIDTHDGKLLKSYRLQSGRAFINDVALTGDAAWFTDSADPVLFKLPLGAKGKLPGAAVRVPITGDLVYADGTNANGIVATPDGRALIVVQSNTGQLFRASFQGRTREIDLGGKLVLNGDGLWLRDHTLYVVQNRLDKIAKIELNRDATRGKVVSTTSDKAFDTPTTIAEYDGRFYLPNARFTTPATPKTSYDAVGIRIP